MALLFPPLEDILPPGPGVVSLIEFKNPAFASSTTSFSSFRETKNLGESSEHVSCSEKVKDRSFFFFLSRFIRSVAARPDVISSSRYAVRRASVQNQTSAHVDAGRLTSFKGRRSEHAGNVRLGVNKSMCAHLAGKQTNARGARGADELLRRIDYFQKSHHAIVAVSIFRATLAVGSV